MTNLLNRIGAYCYQFLLFRLAMKAETSSAQKNSLCYILISLTIGFTLSGTPKGNCCGRI